MSRRTGASVWDLACFSYLAHAQVLHVDRYPRANHGAPVTRSHVSLAADGPITATVAARLGSCAVLVSNQVPSDAQGHAVRHRLIVAGVHHAPGSHTPAQTPHLTVVTDSVGTRTWFADLTHARTSLNHADPAPLGRARLAYIDCYTVLAEPAARAITVAAAGVPLLLNLGNDPVHPAIARAAANATVWAAQTGLPEENADLADTTARMLLDLLKPQTAVVTLGALGALALTTTARHQVAAPDVTVVDTHGAGAAFSAGLACAHLDGCDLPHALERACTAGSDHCATPHQPTLLPVQERTGS